MDRLNYIRIHWAMILKTDPTTLLLSTLRSGSVVIKHCSIKTTTVHFSRFIVQWLDWSTCKNCLDEVLPNIFQIILKIDIENFTHYYICRLFIKSFSRQKNPLLPSLLSKFKDQMLLLMSRLDQQDIHQKIIKR